MEEIEGFVEHIIFRNEENGYSVFVLNYDNNEELTCVGNFPFLNEGEYVSLKGEMTSHNLYGEQFKVSEYVVSTPKDLLAMQLYLGSGAIKGVGEKMAKKIVDTFGAETFNVLENDPLRLAEIKGITEKKAREIFEQFAEKSEARGAMMYLQRIGIGGNTAMKIFQAYGAATQKVLETNPYKLAEDIKGIGFNLADEIAMKMGVDLESDFRVRAGILYTLNQSCQAGNSYLPKEALYRHTVSTLGIEAENFDNILDELSLSRKIYVQQKGDERRVYLSMYYKTEMKIARMLIDLNTHTEIDRDKLLRRLTAVESRLNISLDDIQREAIFMAYENSLMILTGGPGTGKTTIINALISLFTEDELEVLLAAPTGRAAKRMTEATKTESRTIHRLLEFTPSGDGLSDNERMHFEKDEENPLEAHVIIIDEASMMDMHLMNALLRAISVGTKVIFVGDARQLPSVGPGNVLDDMIESGVFPMVRLKKIFRQKEESDIVLNAHKINNGEIPVMDNKSKDFFMLRREDPMAVLGVVKTLVKEKMPKYVDASVFDIQVLTPMRKGELGVVLINNYLQQELNPPSDKKKEQDFGNIKFREGDKVMQIKNNYDLEWRITNRFGVSIDGGTGIFNGDMGRIIDINPFMEEMTIIFDDEKEVTYPFANHDELELAYAVTVHKSQGSEYPAVVIPLLGGPRQLLHRNLLYTAITRGKKCVTIVGREDVVAQMVNNDNEAKRFTGLKDFIVELNNIVGLG